MDELTATLILIGGLVVGAIAGFILARLSDAEDRADYEAATYEAATNEALEMSRRHDDV